LHRSCDSFFRLVSLLNSCLEMLPNELLFLIISHLSWSDLFQALYGLNRRFNSIVLESVRHYMLPKDTPLDWCLKYMPRIENVIETIRVDIKLLPHLFSCTSSYRNLRSIILKFSHRITVELDVEQCSALNGIISCLNLLRRCNILTVVEEARTSHFITNHRELTKDEQVRAKDNITYLSFKRQSFLDGCRPQCFTLSSDRAFINRRLY
jgi:hypothetical protein